MAHNRDNTCLSEENLATLIRDFEKQQKNLLNLVSGNLKITMKKIKSIKTEMNDLKKSIEFTEKVYPKPGGTRDLRPGTHLIGGTRDPTDGTRDPRP